MTFQKQRRVSLHYTFNSKSTTKKIYSSSTIWAGGNVNKVSTQCMRKRLPFYPSGSTLDDSRIPLRLIPFPPPSSPAPSRFVASLLWCCTSRSTSAKQWNAWNGYFERITWRVEHVSFEFSLVSKWMLLWDSFEPNFPSWSESVPGFFISRNLTFQVIRRRFTDLLPVMKAVSKF